MNAIASKDGTAIAYEKIGSGPAVIVVPGAFCDRTFGAQLAQHLAGRHTVYTYDRRARGDSTDGPDTGRDRVSREIEDLDAIIAEAGGSVMAFTHSSGGHLAIKALGRGSRITRLVLYEPPFNPAYQGASAPPELEGRLQAMLGDGKRGDAVETFQTEWLGMPSEVVAQIRSAPFRPALEAMAGSLPYEVALVGTHTDLDAVRVPTLVLLGSDTLPVLHTGAKAVAGGVADAELRVLEGQTHELNVVVTGPVVAEFLSR